MARKKERILLLDTETTGNPGANDNSVYDIAYCIIDNDGTILHERNYVVEQVYNSKEMKESHFSKEKYLEYKIWVETKQVKVLQLEHILFLMDKDIKDYNVKTIGAYNLEFDLRYLNKTTQECGSEIIPFEGLKQLCVWAMACQTIMTTKNYAKFVVEKGLVSKKGNYSTSLETVMRFMNCGEKVTQTHTALDDIKHTVEVYKSCKKTQKKFEPTKKNPWAYANQIIKKRV